MDKTLLHTTMLSAVNAYEPSELISWIVGTVLLTSLLAFVVLWRFRASDLEAYLERQGKKKRAGIRLHKAR